MRMAVLAILLAAGPLVAETLDGKVVEDHSGNPLASVELRVAQAGARQLTADLETDGSGRFHGEGIPAGEYRIEVSKANYVRTTLRMRLGPETGAVLIRLVRFGVISGHVADVEGKMVPGALIAVFTKSVGGVPVPFSNTVTVDERGQYRVYNLPPGQYSIAVSYGASSSAGSVASLRSSVGSGVRFYPDNQNPRWFSVSGGEEYANTDFTLIPSALFRVSGVVQPAGKTYVVALTPSGQPLIPAASSRLDSDKGVFQFEGIPPGSYDLYASGPVSGYGWQTAVLGANPVFGRIRVEVASEDVADLTVPVSPGRSASFILRAASAQQAAGCPQAGSLTLMPVEARGTMTNRTVAVSFAKAAAATDVAPGRYQIAAARLGETCYIAGATLDLTDPSDEPFAVMVAPAASVQGRLLAARIADFLVALVASEPVAGAEPVQVAYPDANGRFSFSDLRPGRYRIGAAPAAEASRARWVADMAKMIELDLPGGAPTEVDLPAPVVEK